MTSALEHIISLLDSSLARDSREWQRVMLPRIGSSRAEATRQPHESPTLSRCMAAWGLEGRDRLGGARADATASTSITTPGPDAEVPGFDGSEGFTQGSDVACAVVDAEVQCWSYSGVVGAPGLPSIMSGISEATAVAVGLHFVCAIVPDGAVMCVGANDQGQLGGGTPTLTNMPVYVLP
jgi:hypothetical protein